MSLPSLTVWLLPVRANAMNAKSGLTICATANAPAILPQASQTTWFKLAEQPLLRIGWIALAGQRLFSYLGGVEIGRIWVCHTPLQPQDTDNNGFRQALDNIARQATRQPPLTITFDEFLPGYQATACRYDHPDWQCLLVEDWAGRYLYLWATAANGRPLQLAHHGPRLDSLPGMPALY